MEMEMMIPIHNMDFDFDSARNSPYPTAPSTPKGFGEYYYSAPPSPSRLTELYSELDHDFYDINFEIDHSSSSEVAFDHFEFDVTEEVEGESVASADNLFDGGMIKPMIMTPHRLPKPPGPRHGESLASAAGSSSMSHGKKKEIDHFTPDAKKPVPFPSERERGRERVQNLSSSSQRATRSLSPKRVNKYLSSDQEEKEVLENLNQSSIVEKCNSSASSKGQKKWRFKDLFLFRNASDGRASDKDLLKKYTTMRVNDQHRPAVGSNSRKKGPVSAHELLYTKNRAAREEEKKKSFLPYKGFWGGKPFNARLANGLGFSH